MNLIREGNSQSLAVVLTFSGGGTRASAFAYGVLEELAATEFYWEGRYRTLISEIDWISAVSGGSFTAAYYALYGDRIFSEFEERFLKKNVQRALTSRFILNPINWFRMTSPYFGRSDLAAKYYDKLLFQGATFADLLARGGPEITINATDMVRGRRFAFDQEQFDWICSELLDFSVSRAVAASSAVPIVLSPVTLHNYGGTCDYRPPDHLAESLQVRDWSSRKYNYAEHLSSYLDREERPYIHLVDGGLSDNLGLRAAVDAVLFAGGAPETLEHYRIRDLRKVLFIVVNAQSGPDERWDRRQRIPSIGSMIAAASRVPLNQYNFETVALLRASLEEWEVAIHEANCPSAGRSPGRSPEDSDPPCEGIDFFLVEVSFEAEAYEPEREYLKSLPTSFNLSDDAVDRLRTSARAILRQSPEFQGILQDFEMSATGRLHCGRGSS